MLETIETYRWGEIVGETSAGNVGNPNWSELPGGWTVYWTGRRALKHDGKTLLNRTGVRPTVPVTKTLHGIAAGRTRWSSGPSRWCRDEEKLSALP